MIGMFALPSYVNVTRPSTRHINFADLVHMPARGFTCITISTVYVPNVPDVASLGFLYSQCRQCRVSFRDVEDAVYR